MDGDDDQDDEFAAFTDLFFAITTLRDTAPSMTEAAQVEAFTMLAQRIVEAAAGNEAAGIAPITPEQRQSAERGLMQLQLSAARRGLHAQLHGQCDVEPCALCRLRLGG